MSSDLTFLTNEPGKALLDRFHALLGKNTRFFDCLVGYFFISGFYKLYPSLEQTEATRILIGLKTDATVFESLERGKERQEALFKSHAQRQCPGVGLDMIRKVLKDLRPQVECLGRGKGAKWKKTEKWKLGKHFTCLRRDHAWPAFHHASAGSVATGQESAPVAGADRFAVESR